MSCLQVLGGGTGLGRRAGRRAGLGHFGRQRSREHVEVAGVDSSRRPEQLPPLHQLRQQLPREWCREETVKARF